MTQIYLVNIYRESRYILRCFISRVKEIVTFCVKKPWERGCSHLFPAFLICSSLTPPPPPPPLPWRVGRVAALKSLILTDIYFLFRYLRLAATISDSKCFSYP